MRSISGRALDRMLIVAVFLPVVAGRGAVLAQTYAGDEVLKSALASFYSAEKRTKITAATASDLAIKDPENWAWFKGFRGKTLETNSNLRPVPGLENVAVPKAKTFSVAGKASPGDVLRVKWTTGGD